jgi:peptide chain release factor 3
MAAREVLTEAARRRTFAVISHPDAGKSTLTEALALHARVIAEAGAVHGKAGRKGVVSDWMEMERARGISITSAALQFEYRDLVINLLDTPGHADFSEDTYRVLSAVGEAGHFAGFLDVRGGSMSVFERAPGGARISEERTLTAAEAEREHGEEWRAAAEEAGLLDRLDLDSFLAGRTTPLLFGAAVANIGVRHLLEVLAELAPAPSARPDVTGREHELEEPFSGFVFKVQAGMDPAHRDRVAFVRMCSGKFERGSVLTHAGTGRAFATKYAQAMFGRDRETVDVAYPGDIVGLVNASALRPGDTLHADGAAVVFPPIPSFAPEHFAVARTTDTSKGKQFRRGIEQLEQEGVVQVLRSDLRGDAAPILAAVGPLQFEVAVHRMAREFGAPITLEHLPYSLARATLPRHVPVLDAERGCEVAERADGALLALFTDRWRLDSVRRNHPEISLDPLVADAEQ